MLYTFELHEMGKFVGNREIAASNEKEATEKLEVALAEEGSKLEYDLEPTLAQACAEIEDQQSWEDEQFMSELDCKYDDDPFAGMSCEHCQGPIEEGHDCQWKDEQEMQTLDSQLGMDEVEESPERGPADWVKRMFDLE